jgi:hypothetical protein
MKVLCALRSNHEFANGIEVTAIHIDYGNRYVYVLCVCVCTYTHTHTHVRSSHEFANRIEITAIHIDYGNRYDYTHTYMPESASETDVLRSWCAERHVTYIRDYICIYIHTYIHTYMYIQA